MWTSFKKVSLPGGSNGGEDPVRSSCDAGGCREKIWPGSPHLDCNSPDEVLSWRKNLPQKLKNPLGVGPQATEEGRGSDSLQAPNF